MIQFPDERRQESHLKYRYAWLQELVRYCLENSSNAALKSIVLEEVFQSTLHRYVPHVWEPPPEMVEDARNANLDLRVVLRRPGPIQGF